MKVKKELIIASCGLFKEQCSLETLMHIKKCDIVFSHIIDDDILHFLKRLSVRVKIIRNLNPVKAAQKVMGAFKEYNKICFLTYGNPLFFNSSSNYLKEKALRADIKTTIVNAVSSFDSIISLLGGTNNFARAGLRIVDIGACMENVEFTTKMCTLVFMVGTLNSKGNEKYKDAFIKKIIATYPKDTQYIMVDAKSIAINKDVLIKGVVGDLLKDFKKITERTTLFLPAIGLEAKNKR